jgi:hypothetical protein
MDIDQQLPKVGVYMQILWQSSKYTSWFIVLGLEGVYVCLGHELCIIVRELSLQVLEPYHEQLSLWTIA